MVKAIDLFSGAGGLSLGFEMAGIDILAGIDVEKQFLRSYEFSHPNSIAILEDLSQQEIIPLLERYNIDPNEVEMIIGGPPCQGFSTAGNRMVDDPRNRLVKVFAKAIKDLNPNLFLMENVSGLASMKNGVGESVADELIKFFEKMGYRTYSKVLVAADYGVPQLRKRIFFVGVRKDIKNTFSWPKKTHYPKGSLMSFSDAKEYLTVIEAISDLPKINAGEFSLEYDCLPKNGYQKWARGSNKKLYNHKAPNHSELVIERIKNIPQGGNHSDLPEELKLKSGYPNIYGRLKSGFPADTITGNFGCASAPGRFIHPIYNRVLTVREGARLQSFPDCIEFFGSLSQMYKQVGNAVPPLMAKSLAKSVLSILEL
jgi:DNA (cytosine-5)-methyltransferase 1